MATGKSKGKSKERAGITGAGSEPDPGELAERAADPQSTSPDEEIEKHLKELTPEQAEIFVRSLEVILRRRRLRLFGYLTALIVFLSTMAVSVYLYGTREPGTFMGWIVLLPFALIAAVFLVVGRLEKRIQPVVPETKTPDPPSTS